MPEPVELVSPREELPGCAVEVHSDVVGLFATQDFDRRPITFKGLQSGDNYVFRIRASKQGLRRPLQVNR